jgi:hypothetical protein
MSPNCTQSLENGKSCSAPAMNGSSFCRHHDPQRRPAKEESRDNETLEFPPLQDKYSILLALDEVIHALAEGRIKRSVAETLISGIKVCSRLVSELIEEGLLAPEEPEVAESAQMPASPEPQFVPQIAAARSSLASGSTKAPIAFSPSHRPSAEPEIDSSTRRMIRELLAQSHAIAIKHAPRA